MAMQQNLWAVLLNGFNPKPSAVAGVEAPAAKAYRHPRLRLLFKFPGAAISRICRYMS